MNEQGESRPEDVLPHSFCGNRYMNLKIVFIVFLFLSAITSNRCVSQWQNISDTALGNILFCKFISPQNGWLINLSNTSEQGLLKTTNNGMTWTKILDHPAGTFNWLLGFDFLDDSIGYAFSTRLTHCFRTLNGGRTWETVGCPTDVYPGYPTAKIFSKNLTYYGSAVEFNRSIDSMQTWQVTHRFPFTELRQPTYRFVFLSTDTIIACGGLPNFLIEPWNGTKECYKSTDGGFDWLPTLYDTLANGYATAFANTIVGYTFSTLSPTQLLHYKTHKTTDGGNSWFQIPATIDTGVVQVTDAYFKNPDEGFITGGAVAHSSDGGLTWHTIPGISGAYMSWPDSLHGWIVGSNGRIFRTTTGGLVPALFASFTGKHTGGTRVRLDWQTRSETNTAGFHLQRRTESDTVFADISPLIPGQGTTSEPSDYSFTDTTATINRWYYRLKVMPLTGDAHYSNTILVDVTTGVTSGLTQYEYKLEQNFPNPFNPSTEIRYQTSEVSHVSLMVFDLLGREVARLVDEVKQPGEFSVGWDASAFSSGIYFYRLHTGAFIQTKRMILMR